MLVLSRQRDETIMIGDDIEITVVDIRGDKIRIGIDAPSGVGVHRKEFYMGIKAYEEAGGGDLGKEALRKQGLSQRTISQIVAKSSGGAGNSEGIKRSLYAPVGGML